MKRLLGILPLVGAYYLIELSAYILLPSSWYGLIFGLAWALMLAGIGVCLPRLAGRIFFGITYLFGAGWTLAQVGYHSVFQKVMWLSDINYAGEGAVFLGDVLGAFPVGWWIFAGIHLTMLVLGIIFFPGKGKNVPQKTEEKGTFLRGITRQRVFTGGCFIAIAVLLLVVMPQVLFHRDKSVWGTRSEFAQATSYKAIYTTMYDANNVYRLTGIYQLTARDFWKHEIYPITPFAKIARAKGVERLDAYFVQRGQAQPNEMTGIYWGKNIVLVLMESMDDWLITREETPTLCRLMEEGISLTDFYTPIYGSARTFNSEFCMNTGMYLPTTGRFVFHYITNDFSQSLPSVMRKQGYSAEVFHYNTAKYYSRGVFEPALGYERYNAYSDYEPDKLKLYDDNLLFDNQGLKEQFFREGTRLNTIITRSAHLGYEYSEALSKFALHKYPEYRGKFPSEEESCARVKAKLVDDCFARLLEELEARGELKNTVIIGLTDHYTYGYKNTEELMALSGVKEKLLLEKTPMFIWSSEGPSLQVDKTASTVDLVPTLLNMMGIEAGYSYLGRDIFDEAYEGYAVFSDGSFISNGLVIECQKDGNYRIIENRRGIELTEEDYAELTDFTSTFREMANELLITDYYRE